MTPTPRVVSSKGINGEIRMHHEQPEFPRLPIPLLEETLRRYVRALEGLQDAREHEATKRAVNDFLKGEGPRIQEKLIAYAKDRARYVIPRLIGLPGRGTETPPQLYRGVLVRLQGISFYHKTLMEHLPCIGTKAT